MATKQKPARRELRAEKRRNEILDEGKAIFLAKDYSSVTMDEIAEAALISRVTLYQYFQGKNDLYGHILLRDMEEMVQSIAQAVNAGKTTQEKIRSLTHEYMNFFQRQPEYFTRLSFFFFPGRIEALPEEIAKRIEERLADGIGVIRDCITSGIANGEVRLVDADALALALWSQLMGYAYAAVVGYAARHGSDDQLVFRTGIEAFIAGISATGQPRT
jgi:AcrR family transcriptional regulator